MNTINIIAQLKGINKDDAGSNTENRLVIIFNLFFFTLVRMFGN